MEVLSYLRIVWILFLLAGITLVSCGEDEAEIMEAEPRTITSLRYILGTSGGNPPVEFSYSDPDGDGGADPVITGGVLAANAIYFGDLKLLNETASPTEDINALINAAREDHQFFFLPSNLDLTITYADVDDNNNPIGLFTALTTGASGTGTLTISLQRGLNKFGEGVADGQINNAGGTTDIQVQFPITIQ